MSKFSLTERLDVQVLQVTGELELGCCDIFRNALDQAAEAAGDDAFVVDLSELDHIGSAGIRALVQQQKLLSRQGRRLIVAGMAGPVRETLEICQIDSLLDTVDSVDAALDSLNGKRTNGAHHPRA